MAQAATGTSRDERCHMAVGCSVVRDRVSGRSQSDPRTETTGRLTPATGTSTWVSRFPVCSRYVCPTRAATMAQAAL